MYAIIRGIFVGALLVTLGCSSTKPVKQTTFATPDAAVDGLISALRTDSVDSLVKVLGPEAEDLLYSGDPVQDHNARVSFLERYDQRHQMVGNEDGSVTLVVGDNQWPMPIPVVRDGDVWRFDTARGEDEIINRRVGDNELSTINVCRAFVDAQRDYRAINPEGNGAYAEKLLSDDGRKNGLFWKTEPGQPPSPMGEFVADAADEGYRKSVTRQPYHGYYFRLLRGQGPHAPGGEQNYMKNGKLTEGFAVIAWPAEYGDSGIMSFLVSHNGIVYQRDLGEKTAQVAEAIQAFDPDAKWSICEE